jgi:hypothetical protein
MPCRSHHVLGCLHHVLGCSYHVLGCSHGCGTCAAGAYYEVFNELLLEHSPTLYAHLDEKGISCGMYLFSWLQTMFLQVVY